MSIINRLQQNKPVWDDGSYANKLRIFARAVEYRRLDPARLPQ